MMLLTCIRVSHNEKNDKDMYIMKDESGTMLALYDNNLNTMLETGRASLKNLIITPDGKFKKLDGNIIEPEYVYSKNEITWI